MSMAHILLFNNVQHVLMNTRYIYKFSFFSFHSFHFNFFSVFCLFEENLLSTFSFGFILCYLSCHRSKCHRFISLLCLLFLLFVLLGLFFEPPCFRIYMFLWLPAVPDPRDLALLPAGLVIDFSFMDS